jgi:hypothetical protein
MCLAGWPAAGAAAQALPAAIAAEPSGLSATVIVVNRPVVVLSARVLGRSPAERADAARRAVDDLVARGITGLVAR